MMKRLGRQNGERGSTPGRPASLSQEDKLFLMLVRLCLNLKEYDLAHRFEVSQSSVSRIFSTWINYCYLRLGTDFNFIST